MALLSCFVWQERMEKGVRLREKLQSVLTELLQAARRVGKVSPATAPGLLPLRVTHSESEDTFKLNS